MITIHDLQPSTTYVISVAAVNSGGTGVYGNVTASTLPCELAHINVTSIRYLCVFCTVQVKLLSTTPNAISLTWSEAGSAPLNDLDIKICWQRSSSNFCHYEESDMNSTMISGLMLNATIHGLEEYSSYNITVTIRSSISNSTTAMTKESGMFI